jgi:hypothetical protein
MLINKNEVTLLTGASPSAEPLVIKYREEKSNEKLRVTEHFDESGNFTGINIFFPCKIIFGRADLFSEISNKSLESFRVKLEGTLSSSFNIVEGDKVYSLTPRFTYLPNPSELFEDDIVLYLINVSNLQNTGETYLAFVNQIAGKKIYAPFGASETIIIAHEICHILGLLHVEAIIEWLESIGKNNDASLINAKYNSCNLMRRSFDGAYNTCLTKDINILIPQYHVIYQLFKENKLLQGDNLYKPDEDRPSNKNTYRGVKPIVSYVNIEENLKYFKK